MSAKTAFIVIVTTLLTIVMMKNTEEVNFWIFGNHSFSKITVMGGMLGVGLIVGFIAGRGRKTQTNADLQSQGPVDYNQTVNNHHEEPNDPNEDYISYP